MIVIIIIVNITIIFFAILHDPLQCHINMSDLDWPRCFIHWLILCIYICTQILYVHRWSRVYIYKATCITYIFRFWRLRCWFNALLLVKPTQSSCQLVSWSPLRLAKPKVSYGWWCHSCLFQNAFLKNRRMIRFSLFWDGSTSQSR